MIKPMKKRIFGQLVQEPVKSSIILMDAPDINKCRFLVKAVAEDVQGISVGDTVLLKKHAGTEMEYENEPHLIVKQEDVLGVFEGV